MTSPSPAAMRLANKILDRWETGAPRADELRDLIDAEMEPLVEAARAELAALRHELELLDRDAVPLANSDPRIHRLHALRAALAQHKRDRA